MGLVPSRIDWVKAVAAVAIPLVVLFVGLAIDRSISDADRSAQYLEVAVGVLSDPPPGEEASDDVVAADLALRSWAVDILQDNSPIPIPQDAAEALRLGEIQVGPGSGTTGGFQGGGGASSGGAGSSF